MTEYQVSNVLEGAIAGLSEDYYNYAMSIEIEDKTPLNYNMWLYNQLLAKKDKDYHYYCLFYARVHSSDMLTHEDKEELSLYIEYIMKQLPYPYGEVREAAVLYEDDIPPHIISEIQIEMFQEEILFEALEAGPVEGLGDAIHWLHQSKIMFEHQLVNFHK